jgi:hypothetical protein
MYPQADFPGKRLQRDAGGRNSVRLDREVAQPHAQSR